MNENKYLKILTDGGKEVGFGHITRCIALSKAFEKKGFKIEFIIYGDSSINSILTYPTTIFNWHKDKKKLFSSIKNSTLLLADSMLISDELLLELERKNAHLIFIDDEKKRNVINRGFILDWTVLGEKRNNFLPRKKEVIYLLGSRYAPLRQEFSFVSTKKIDEDIKSIMVTFGGSDVRNLTPKILSFLIKNYPDIKKNIIIGNGFQNFKEIEPLADINTSFIVNADAKQMIETMQNSDICIGSGGQTLYELAFVGVPTIGILLVENAKEDTFGWRDAGFLEYIGWYNDPNLLDHLRSAIDKMRDKKVREKMQKNAQKHITPNGAMHIADIVLENI